MKVSHLFPIFLTAVMAIAVSPLHARSDASETLRERLAGANFTGVYLRAGTPYSMDFGRDGSLGDSAGRSGRWWISEQGQYCREWQDGPMAGIETCMEVVFHLDRVAIYSGEDKVLEGEILRPSE